MLNMILNQCCPMTHVHLGRNAKYKWETNSIKPYFFFLIVLFSLFRVLTIIITKIKWPTGISAV